MFWRLRPQCLHLFSFSDMAWIILALLFHRNLEQLGRFLLGLKFHESLQQWIQFYCKLCISLFQHSCMFLNYMCRDLHLWGGPKRKARVVRQTQDAVSPSGERKRNAHKQEPEMHILKFKFGFLSIIIRAGTRGRLSGALACRNLRRWPKHSGVKIKIFWSSIFNWVQKIH